MQCFFRPNKVVKMYAMETISEKRRISALRHFQSIPIGLAVQKLLHIYEQKYFRAAVWVFES